MIRQAVLFYAVVVTVSIASSANAVDLFWQGGAGTLLDPNYSNGTTTGNTPATGDVVNFGAAGTGTLSTSVNWGKLRVGHDQPTLPGAGTVTINNSAFVELTAGASGAPNAAMWIGNVGNGILNIDNAFVVANQLVMVGYGNNVNRSGRLNITNGGSLTVSAGNLNMGERATAAGGGVQGHITMDGATSTLFITGNGADLTVGMRRAQSSYTQTGGALTVRDQIIVGESNSDGSSFSVSGGTVTTEGSMVVSNGTAAQDYSDNISATFSGNSVTTLGSSFTIGLEDSRNATLTIADDAFISTPHNDPPNGAGSFFVGRGRSQNTTFNMTGGTLDIGTRFLMGSVESAVINAGGSATNIVGNHSGGTIDTVLDFTLADTNGDSTYNLSGTGNINAGAFLIVGRQRKLGTMNQISGTVASGQGVRIGDAFSSDTAVFGSGVYNISGGSLTANTINTNPALSVAPAGTGTFRVIGDDAAIDVNGDMLVNAGGGSQGTLAYRLETGETLSMIDVSGNATFNAGSILSFDLNSVTPTQTSYNVLTAASIIDNGIVFDGPAGWGYEIIDGEVDILQIVQGVTPPGLDGDHNEDGVVDAADYVVWKKFDINGPQGYNDFVADFGESSAGAGGSGQVPEPTTVGMLMLAGLLGATYSRRRGGRVAA